MRIQTLREQGLGYRAISVKYPEKNWKLDTVKLICKHVDEMGSSLTRKPGRWLPDQPRSVHTAEMIEQVGGLICLQGNHPGASKISRKIAEQLNLHRSSIQRIVKRDLWLSAFRRIPAQITSESVKQKCHECCKKLIRRLLVKFTKKVFFTDEKNFYCNPPVNHQNDRVWSIGKDVRRRQKAPCSGEGEICQARHGLCWCMLWCMPDKAKVSGKL